MRHLDSDQKLESQFKRFKMKRKQTTMVMCGKRVKPKEKVSRATTPFDLPPMTLVEDLKVLNKILPRDIVGHISTFDSRQPYYNICSVPEKDTDSIPLYVCPVTNGVPMLTGWSSRETRVIPAALLRGRDGLRGHPDLDNFFSKGGLFPSTCKLFQTCRYRFQKKSVEVGQQIRPDGLFFIDPVAALQNFFDQRMNAFAGVKRGALRKKGAPPSTRSRYDTLVIHHLRDDIPAFPISKVPYERFTIGVGNIIVQGKLKSTVKWKGIVDVNQLGSAEAPFGTISSLDFIRLVVVETELK
jgi:hypothetical protein